MILSAIFICSKVISCENICKTKECQSEAERVKGMLNKSVSPCDDFYQFACGNYNPEFPDGKGQVLIYTELQDLLEVQINETMSEKIFNTDINPFKLVKNFFQSCMDTSMLFI